MMQEKNESKRLGAVIHYSLQLFILTIVG